MIDPSAFRIFEPNCSFNLPVQKNLERDKLTDEQYMICTPILLGFCFGVKMWGVFQLPIPVQSVYSPLVPPRRFCHGPVRRYRLH